MKTLIRQEMRLWAIETLNFTYYFSFALAIKWFLKGTNPHGYLSDMQAGLACCSPSVVSGPSASAETYQKCTFSGLTPDLSETSGKGPVIYVSTSIPGGSDPLKFENHCIPQATEQTQRSKGEEVLMKVEFSEWTF